MPKNAPDLLAQAQAVEVIEPEEGTVPTIETRKINVPASRLEEFAKLVQETYPDAQLNANAIAKGGKTPSGDPICVFAVVQKNPTGTAAVYHTGKGSLSGEMTGLDW
jgi:hypothetical protein